MKFFCQCALTQSTCSPIWLNDINKVNETTAEITELIQGPDNLLAQDKLFLGYLARSQIKKLLSEGDISQFECDNFFDACQAFHKEAFLYAVKWVVQIK